MADNYLERVAGELADLAIADQAATGDENIVDNISEILGSSSQTLQEAFLTAVRVRRAEARARKVLSERAAKPVRMKSRLLPDEDKPAPHDEEAITLGSGDEPRQPAPPSAEDEAFADVLNTLDEFLHSDETDDAASPSVAPGRPSRE